MVCLARTCRKDSSQMATTIVNWESNDNKFNQGATMIRAIVPLDCLFAVITAADAVCARCFPPAMFCGKLRGAMK